MNTYKITKAVASNQHELANMLGVDDTFIRMAKTLSAPGFKGGSKTEIDCNQFVPWFNDHYEEIADLLKDKEEVLRIEESKALKEFYLALTAKDQYLESRKQLVPITDIEKDYQAHNMSITILLMKLLTQQLGSKCVGKTEAEINAVGKKVFFDILNIINASDYCKDKITVERINESGNNQQISGSI